MTYSINVAGRVIRDSDGTAISQDPSHDDRIKYNAWVAQGNVATPYTPSAPEQAAIARQASLDVDLNGDATLAQLRAMSASELDTWFAANVTDIASMRNVVRRMFKIIVRRVL